MSSLKDKVIKWLGGFTKAEVEEIKTEEDLPQGLYIVHNQLNTVRLYSEVWLWQHERISELHQCPEDHLLRILAEGLTEEIKDHMSIEVSTDGQKRFYRGEIEVVVREGGE